MTPSISPDLSIIVLDNVPWTAANWDVPRTVADQTHFIKYVLFFSLTFDSAWSSAPLQAEEAVLQHLNELISQLAGPAASRRRGEGASPGLQKLRKGWREDLVLPPPDPTRQAS